ncbi:MAG: N-6 DNA methylase [Propionibacteriaceae bacterium]
MEAYEQWGDTQDVLSIELDIHGRIIDFLDPAKQRPNTPEERVRQQFARSLHFEYGYPKEQMALAAPVSIGSESREADIVIYRSVPECIARNQAAIILIVETKAPNKVQGRQQLFSYVFATSAMGGIWVNGTAPIAVWRRQQEPQDLLPWPGLPRYREPWDAVGKYKKSKLIVPHDLKPVFKKCHNAIYRVGIDSEDVALDMVRIILAKQRDESLPGDDCLFRCTPEEYSTPAGRHEVAERVRSLFEQVKADNRDVFRPQEEVTAGENEIATVVTQLQQFSFLDSPYDVIGTAYEIYVASHLKGERGQYFTNRLVINLMVTMVDPSERDRILDPACGSGGFLIACLSYVTRKVQSSNRSESAKSTTLAGFRNRLFGIDKTPKLAKVAKANMLLSKDGHTGIIHGDSLGDLGDLGPEFLNKAGPHLPTVILTNPPFGSGYELRINEHEILKNYSIGRNATVRPDGTVAERSNTAPGVPPELLFLERCIDWVAPGGRIGIVMARGQLDNREAIPAREHLLRTCRVLAIVNTHEDTFEPFCGSKASLLILQKKQSPGPDPEDYRIFMAISKKIGQNSRGEPKFKRDAEGNLLLENGQPVLDHDLGDIAAAYRRWKNGDEPGYAFAFETLRSSITGPDYYLNPVKFLPMFTDTLKAILDLGESEDWELRRLGDIAQVFNGPRFKRPYADEGVTEGPGIYRYFTGTAMTQSKAENVKYLDESKADKVTRRYLEELVIHRGWILITDSGTLGRVIYAREQHDGAIATNNLVRIVIEDEAVRGYVYQFLISDAGQHQLLKNAYGTNQDHLEPYHVEDVLIPFPKDRERVNIVSTEVLRSIDALEDSERMQASSQELLRSLLDDRK